MRITPPTPGQLIDTDYLYQIADAINKLGNDYEKSSAKANIVTNRSSKVSEPLDTLGLAVEGGYATKLVDVKKAGEAETITYPFQNKFKYPPIVTATPQIITTGANKDVTGIATTIQSVSTSSVTVKMVFDSKSGRTNIGVNIIAVGVPAAT